MQPAPASPPPGMSAMSAAIGAGAQNAFSVGRVIARTFSTWWKHVVAFSVLSLAATSPFLLVALLGDVPIPGINAPSASPLGGGITQPRLPSGFWWAYLAMLLLFVVEAGAITHGVINHLAGKRVSLGGMVAAGVRRAVPLLAVGILSYVLFAFGFLLLVLPGVFLACALAVAIPAVVVERPGPFGAIRRSFALTKGRRLAVLAVFLVFGVVTFGVSTGASFVLPIVTARFASETVGVVLGFAVNVMFGTLLWVAPAVLYHDLRVAKEGVATSQLAAVFE